MQKIELQGSKTILTVVRVCDEAIGDKSFVTLNTNVDGALKEWAASTRISPMWAVRCANTVEFPEFDATNFSGQILFMGPVSPHLAFCEILRVSPKEASNPIQVFLTLGMFNTIAFYSSNIDCQEIIQRCQNNNANWELWQVELGYIVKTRHSNYRKSSSLWRNTLLQIKALDWPPAAQCSVDEFLPLAAATLARCEAHAPQLLNTLLRHLETVAVMGEASQANSTETSFFTAVDGQDVLIHVNAGLSRFSSHTFSGTSPILATECHFWPHSLLGIGVANLGLSNLVSFIENTMAMSFIPNKISQLGKVQYPGRDLRSLNWDDKIWQKYFLDAVPFPEATSKKAHSLIAYFSGRGGFRSHHSTLSAPISTISSSNALPWTMLTVTHEVSHVVIGGVLTELSPKLDDQAALGDALGRVNKIRQCSDNTSQPVDWLESLRLLYLRCVVFEIESTKSPAESVQIELANFKMILMASFSDVTEIMVHTFDFLYFYDQISEKYIRGIWTSWSAIPNISDRIPEYVIRTVCAISAKYLGNVVNPVKPALQEVHEAFVKITKSGDLTYVQQAIDYMEHSLTELEEKIFARLTLVKIVRTFIYSPKLAKELFDHKQTNSNGEDGSNPQEKRQLTQQSISNPLHYIQASTNGMAPSDLASFVQWTNLAFNINTNAK